MQELHRCSTERQGYVAERQGWDQGAIRTSERSEQQPGSGAFRKIRKLAQTLTSEG